MLLKSSKLIASLLLGLVLATGSLHVWAEDTASTTEADSSANVSMLGWANSMGIVEQLQAIHRISQNSSTQAFQSLMSALDSPFQLARRKASRSLLEKSHKASPEDRLMLVNLLKTDLKDTDPVVQKNLIRTMADLNIPEAREALKSFFTSAPVKQQLDAVDALSLDADAASLNLAKQYSAFPEIRDAAGNTLK